jgi:type VI secretion system secreted protein Hcp
MKRLLWIGIVVLVLVVLAVPAWMALDDDSRRAGALAQPAAGAADLGNLTLVGGKSGTIVVPVQSYELGIKSPRDAATGMATGQAKRSPVQIIKPIDANTPVLFSMLAGNEQIQSAKLDLIAPDANGKPSTYMSYDLGSGAISSWDDGANETITFLGNSLSATGKGATGAQAVGQMTIMGQTLPITGFTTGVSSPRDAASGLATGKRQHKPFTVTRPVDALAPSLFTGLQNNQALGSVKIELQRPNSKGVVATYATYTYGNAHLSAVDDSGAAGSTPEQRLELVYETIEVKVGGKIGSDSLGTTNS